MSLPSENKMATICVVQIHMHARFPRSKNGRLVMWPYQHRKRSSFATKHFQSKCFVVLGKLLSFVARIITFKVRCWVTDTHTHRPSTVTLAAHARRGLIIYLKDIYFKTCHVMVNYSYRNADSRGGRWRPQYWCEHWRYNWLYLINLCWSTAPTINTRHLT